MYRIMLGEDDIPSSERRNKLIKGDSYTDKVLTRAIYNVNKDKQRWVIVHFPEEVKIADVEWTLKYLS